MVNLNQWLKDLKISNPQIESFIEIVESYISEEGFNSDGYEKILDSELQSLQKSFEKQLTDSIFQ